MAKADSRLMAMSKVRVSVFMTISDDATNHELIIKAKKCLDELLAQNVGQLELPCHHDELSVMWSICHQNQVVGELFYQNIPVATYRLLMDTQGDYLDEFFYTI